MRVYLKTLPGAVTSRAMVRVSDALERYAPAGVQVIKDLRESFDLHVLHVIGECPKDVILAPEYAVIQYCHETAALPGYDWMPLWRGARLLWSYYDLNPGEGVRFMRSPLGLDDAFLLGPVLNLPRSTGVMTSGYVSGARAEAVEEMAEAALLCGLDVFHLGPRDVQGMMRRVEKSWFSDECINDDDLRAWYSRCKWVSGLRHVEGFELPVIEGLSCGARPIVFDRPDMRVWYDGLAIFVPECHGPELVDRLVGVLARPVKPVTQEEQDYVRCMFNWKTIATRFWEKVL